MRADRRNCRRLAALSQIQALRLSQSELALVDARQALKQAESTVAKAQHCLTQSETELAETLASGSFSVNRFRIMAQVLAAQSNEVERARSHAEQAGGIEADKALYLRQARYQMDWLHETYRNKFRTMRRKEDELKLADATLLTIHRSDGGHR